MILCCTCCTELTNPGSKQMQSLTTLLNADRVTRKLFKSPWLITCINDLVILWESMVRTVRSLSPPWPVATYVRALQTNWDCWEHGLATCCCAGLSHSERTSMATWLIGEFPESHATLSSSMSEFKLRRTVSINIYLLWFHGDMDMHYACVHCPAVDNVVAILLVIVPVHSCTYTLHTCLCNEVPCPFLLIYNHPDFQNLKINPCLC